MNETDYADTIYYLGFLPLAIYTLVFATRRQEHFETKQFGKWYFFFECSFYTIVGIFPSALINALFYSDDKPLIPRFTSALFLFVTMYVAIMLCIRIYLYDNFQKTRLSDFRPFIREIMGKNPYPDSDKPFPEWKTQPTWLFKGCATLFAVIVVTIIELIVLLTFLK
ncbi:hypothetical protein CMUST_01580 [Corynebacterium mustelae]|uniref:Uncharacterized protein n=1 Tax=Corynebacterium mustelae TaxID=571915 RepID=A0A0G3GVY3_9CORY|nr:hypothetical protein [Corynebacterium mustelae]AKK04665.1 hypothetical protein CMUST_01580 [Corynebacterium mustelae]